MYLLCLFPRIDACTYKKCFSFEETSYKNCGSRLLLRYTVQNVLAFSRKVAINCYEKCCKENSYVDSCRTLEKMDEEASDKHAIEKR